MHSPKLFSLRAFYLTLIIILLVLYTVSVTVFNAMSFKTKTNLSPFRDIKNLLSFEDTTISSLFENKTIFPSLENKKNLSSFDDKKNRSSFDEKKKKLKRTNCYDFLEDDVILGDILDANVKPDKRRSIFFLMTGCFENYIIKLSVRYLVR